MMAVCNLPVWDVIVLIGGNDDRIYTIRRDMDLEAEIVSRLSAWWQRYIVNGEDHPIDGSDAAAGYLSDRFPEDKAPRIGADTEADDIGRRLAGLKAQIKDLETEEKDLTNQLKEKVGDASGMDGNGWRCTWTGGREKEAVDFKTYAGLLSDQLHALGKADLIAQSMAASRETKRSPRMFRFTNEK